jgi:indole-3-glycerol phosphate synthase
MHQRLAEILAEKKIEVARLKKATPFDAIHGVPPPRDFKTAISCPPAIGLIAEIKFASPSAGLIREKTDPTTIGRIYEKAGAAAISLLTDQKFFQGDLSQLPRLKRALTLPILRKDFIIDEVQVQESKIYGADAILLIARILPRSQLEKLISMCRELNIAPLTEIHDREDLEKAVTCGAEIIGINNRDLDSFKVDINTTFRLAPEIPKDRILVSESGISQKEDIFSLRTTGIQAVLVGSALMGSNDLAGKAAQFVDAGLMYDAKSKS